MSPPCTQSRVPRGPRGVQPRRGGCGTPAPGAGGRSCAERLARKAILFLVSWMMHSTWRCITHSCYITLARKFKTSGLGWKWWFNYYLWITTTTAREKKGLKTFFFFFFPLFKARPSLTLQRLCPQLPPSPCGGEQPPGRAPSGGDFWAWLGCFGHTVPLPSEGVPSFLATPAELGDTLWHPQGHFLHQRVTRATSSSLGASLAPLAVLPSGAICHQQPPPLFRPCQLSCDSHCPPWDTLGTDPGSSPPAGAAPQGI